MPDPVTLYVYEPFVPLSADGSGSDARYRNATPAEVLAHPAVLALVAENAALVRECDRWRHGEPVEEDYVCPGDLRADEAEKERDRLREAVDSALCMAAEGPDAIGAGAACREVWRILLPALRPDLVPDRAAEGREG